MQGNSNTNTTLLARQETGSEQTSAHMKREHLPCCVNKAVNYKQNRLQGCNPMGSVKTVIPSCREADNLKGTLLPLILCCGISTCIPTTVHKCIWKYCLFYLQCSHVTAEHDGTREKADITSHQLSLYTAEVLPEHTLDTVLDLGSRGPEGSRAPKGKRVCIWY